MVGEDVYVVILDLKLLLDAPDGESDVANSVVRERARNCATRQILQKNAPTNLKP